MTRVRPSRPAMAVPAGLLLAAAALPLHAAMPEGPPPPLQQAWTLSLWTLLPLALALGLYAAGLARLWRASGTGRGVSVLAASAFVLGVAALGLALVWPLDAYAAHFLSAHVAQHMTLLALAPPLLLAGRPFAMATTALPRRVSRLLHRGLRRPALGLVGALGVATVAHCATMWAWHLPGATAAALASEPLHRTMHASFLLAGLWFWAAVWHRLRTPDAGAAASFVALVTAMMLMGFLGALLTFSPRLLYPAYSERALLAGVDPMHDQQLAGLLMWVPSGLPYLAVALWLTVALLRRIQRRAASGQTA